MVSLSSSQVNYLIWRYFQDEGLALSGYALDKETRAGQDPHPDIQDTELVKLLLKGLQMQEIENAAGAAGSILPANSAATVPADKRTIASGTADGATEGATDGATVTASESASESASGPIGEATTFEVDGVVNVQPPNHTNFIGGVASAFNMPLALVVAGFDSVIAYVAESNDVCHETVLECADSPTCIEPLGVGIQYEGQCVLVGYASGCVRNWQFNDKQAVLQGVLHPQIANSGPVLTLRASPSGSRAAAADSRTGSISVWDLTQRRLICAVNGDADSPNSEHGVVGDLAWIGGDSTLAVAYAAGIAVIRIPEPTTAGAGAGTGAGTASGSSTPAAASGADITPGSGSSSSNNDLAPAGHLAWLSGHDKPVSVLAFDELTQLLASGGDDGRVCVWNAQSPEPVHQFNAGSIATAPVSHVSWFGVYLLTATTDGTLRLWDVRCKPPTILTGTDVGEPVFALEVSRHTPPHIAVITPSGMRLYMLSMQPPKLTPAGSVVAKGIQCISWASDQSLAITSKNKTIVVRC